MSVQIAGISGRNKYIDILSESWAEHLKEKEDSAPTVISTFAGIGGSSLGYSMAGFRELMAVERDEHAVQNFKLNFPEIPVYHGDIQNLTVDKISDMTGLKPGDLDVLDGSPPCQGFSTSNTFRKIEDERNKLFMEFARLLNGLQPKMFVMENVYGLVKGRMKLVFSEILRSLKSAGYNVQVRLMNVMFFNVPQSRQRLIFLGSRSDIRAPSYPKPFSAPFSFREATDSLDSLGMSGPKLTGKVLELSRRMKENGDGSDIEKNKWFNLKKLDRNRPSRTIPKSRQILHPTENRWLSINELKRLGSFPDPFRLTGTHSQQWAGIGNSVPPVFMKRISEHIRINILSGAIPTSALTKDLIPAATQEVQL